MTYHWWEKKGKWSKENLQNIIFAVYSIPNFKLGDVGFWAGYRFPNRTWRQWFILQIAFLEIVDSRYGLFLIHTSIGGLYASNELSWSNYRKELIGAPPEQKRIQEWGKSPKVRIQTKTPFAMTNSVPQNCRLKAPCNTSSKQQNLKDQSGHWQVKARHNWEAPYHWSLSSFMNTESK